MDSCSCIVVLLASLIARGTHCNPKIDEGHIRQYADCGTIANTPLGRMVNTKEAETHYPWVIRIERYNQRKPPKPPDIFQRSECVGAIITERY